MRQCANMLKIFCTFVHRKKKLLNNPHRARAIVVKQFSEKLFIFGSAKINKKNDIGKYREYVVQKKLKFRI